VDGVERRDEPRPASDHRVWPKLPFETSRTAAFEKSRRSAACPAERQFVLVLLALGQMGDAGVTEHPGDIDLGVDLEDQVHRLVALGAEGVLDALDPGGPATEFVAGCGVVETP